MESRLRSLIREEISAVIKLNNFSLQPRKPQLHTLPLFLLCTDISRFSYNIRRCQTIHYKRVAETKVKGFFFISCYSEKYSLITKTHSGSQAPETSNALRSASLRYGPETRAPQKPCLKRGTLPLFSNPHITQSLRCRQRCSE